MSTEHVIVIGGIALALLLILISGVKKSKAKKKAAAEKRAAEKKAAEALVKAAEKTMEKKSGDKSTVKSKTASGKKPEPKPDGGTSRVKKTFDEKPKKEKKSVSTPPSGEMEVLLQCSGEDKTCWVCRYCGAENLNGFTRCQVCGQAKT